MAAQLARLRRRARGGNELEETALVRSGLVLLLKRRSLADVQTHDAVTDGAGPDQTGVSGRTPEQRDLPPSLFRGNSALFELLDVVPRQIIGSHGVPLAVNPVRSHAASASR